MTTAELAQQILLWIRKTHTDHRQSSEVVFATSIRVLVDDIETLCKEQLAPTEIRGVNQSLDQPSSIPGLTEGRMCHYTAYNGRCMAALVIGHEPGGQADLAVFTNLANVNGVKNFGMQFHQDIPYSEEPRPGTWHWIEQA